MVINSLKEIPENILKLYRKNPILHKEKISMISNILYTRTTKMFLEKNQFFIGLKFYAELGSLVVNLRLECT